MTRLIGVVHLAALPGSPRATLPLEQIVERALADAAALDAGGADAIIVENYHDVPFRPERVEAHTVAAMTIVVREVVARVSCAVGVNVLRNDASAALGIAAMTGATFIRVNVHTGAMVTDQGIINGRADETLRLRRSLGAEQVEVFADILVKHGVPFGNVSIEDAARDAVERGLADAVIVSGSATGVATLPSQVEAAAASTLAPVYVGSGVTAANASSFLPAATGVIVGTWLKREGNINNVIDIERVRTLRKLLDIPAEVRTDVSTAELHPTLESRATS
jgi:membrane complex biogenesis BtpA family protein